jgi:hypothetical protein
MVCSRGYVEHHFHPGVKMVEAAGIESASAEEITDGVQVSRFPLGSGWIIDGFPLVFFILLIFRVAIIKKIQTGRVTTPRTKK